MIITDECMPIHIVIMMRYLISQVWREQNTEVNVHLFDNANDNRYKNKL